MDEISSIQYVGEEKGELFSSFSLSPLLSPLSRPRDNLRDIFSVYNTNSLRVIWLNIRGISLSLEFASAMDSRSKVAGLVPPR